MNKHPRKLAFLIFVLSLAMSLPAFGQKIKANAGKGVPVAKGKSKTADSNVSEMTPGGPGTTGGPEIGQGFGGDGDSIVARRVFYNNSAYDVVSDDDAIDPNKSPMFDGETAEFANYTSYYLGLNGIMIDVNGLIGTPTIVDFEFRIGEDDFPDQWATAPNPTIEVINGGGEGGSDRIKLIWADEAISKAWLQVRVIANGTTGLVEDDVFYFGNIVGETGNNPEDADVNLSDVAGARLNQTGFGTTDINDPYDLTRDMRVRLDDVAVARFNQSGFTPVPLITPQSGVSIPAGLGRGVNFGNMLEAPSEGAWGLTVQELFFDKVVEAGLEHIRMPISWTHHAATVAPYTIDETFFARVDWCVAQAKSRGLKIIVNDHHHEELDTDPAAEWDRALAIWGQIAARYQNEPDTVFFEILNEPHGEFNNTPATWNLYMEDALNVIRATNPTRKVLVGPVFFNSISALDTFSPPDDPDLIATVHYYEPFVFTHQGAEWVDNPPPLGTTWEGDRVGFADTFQSWSWNTTIDPTSAGTDVTYDAGWAGLRFHGIGLVEGASELHLKVDGAINLQIWFKDENDVDSAQVSLQTAAGSNSYIVDLSALGDTSEIRDVLIQNFSPTPQATVTFEEARLCGIGVTANLIESELDTLRNSFRTAGAWSVANNMPVHVGEFGAYSTADLASRVLWTTAVREASEDYNIDWAYWEFGAGFGFYNPANNTWRLPLLQALNPDFGN